MNMQLPEIIVCIYLAAVNAAAFICVGSDKSRAIKHQWRIRESVLFLMALIGGSIGSILGMIAFRHKTKHLKFVIGMPAILAIQVLAALFILSGTACISGNSTMKNSVFSWYEDYDGQDAIDRMTALCGEYRIDTVYQYAEKKKLSAQTFQDFAAAMKKAGIRTVLIYDEPEYDAEEFSGYLKAMKKADRNQCVEGIIADIEPFSDGKAKDAAALEEYVSYMKIYGDLAHEQGLKYLIAIPTWYDTISESLTAQLIADADRTVLMNYTTDDFIEPIAFEADAASKAEKEIENAAELQAADRKQGISDEMTYAGRGIQEVLSNFEEIHEAYPAMRGCFHHYRTLYQMVRGHELP
jgi:uncharacterized membrane protein YsdA (DUF1294 family)